MRNPVKRHMHKAVRASVVASKRRSMLLDTTLRESTEILFESDLDKETIPFEDSYNDGCNGCLNDIGCSSVMIDSYIDDFEGEK